MKEVLLPYIFLCWLLVKLKVIQASTRNLFFMITGGVLLFLTVVFSGRLWAPIDLTQSTQVRAPHSVLSPAVGMQVEEILVDHNQAVKKGDLLYTLTDNRLQQDRKSIEANIASAMLEVENRKADVDVYKVKLAQLERRLDRISEINSHVSPEEIEMATDDVQNKRVALDAAVRMIEASERVVAANTAQLNSLNIEIDNRQITAPFDGRVSHVYFAEGSRIGALHLWDTSKKFVEMRVPDQAYGNIREGQFAEFYVDAFPGQIFRARVHSIVKGTGESQGSIFPTEQAVSTFIQAGSAPIGRTVILEFEAPEGIDIPIGATGSAWISADKPHAFLGFLDIISAVTLRAFAMKSYITSF